MNDYLPIRKYLKCKRKNLRNNGTSAEAVLWIHLKCKKLLGRKFRRQHSINNFIVDFYCPEEKLIVEVDGEGHYNVGGQVADSYRDEDLSLLGMKTMRFENREIFDSIENVLEEISSHYKTRTVCG
jgi:very-short-patch-repair endonuclease